MKFVFGGLVTVGVTRRRRFLKRLLLTAAEVLAL